MLAFWGLHFNHSWDLTAAGTLALAVVTVGVLVIAGVSLRQTRKEIALSRTEVEEAHRPVVIPVLGKEPMDLGADGSDEKRPRLLRDGRLVVPVENIGSGPALNVKASVDVLGDGDKPSGRLSDAGLGRVAGLGAGRFEPLFLSYGLPAVIPFALTLEYDDVAGKCWQTDCVFTGTLYEGIKLEPHQPTRRAVSGMTRGGV